MGSLFHRDKYNRVYSLMSKYEEVKAWYSYVGAYANHGYDGTNPLYVSIFSYIDDGNKERSTNIRGTSARQYYIYNQGLSLADINIPKSSKEKVTSASQFKTMLDSEVDKYLSKVAGKYKGMPDAVAHKILERRVKEHQKDLGIHPVGSNEEFNRRFIKAVFRNAEIGPQREMHDEIKKAFKGLQTFINKNIEQGAAEIKAKNDIGSGKKNYYVLEIKNGVTRLEREYYKLLKKLAITISKASEEGALDAGAEAKIITLLNSLKSKVLAYEKKANRKPVKGTTIRYINSNGVKMDLKDLTVGKDKDRKLHLINLVSSILGNAAGLGYEISILAAASALMDRGQKDIEKFRDVSHAEMKGRILDLLTKDSRTFKSKKGAKKFSGAVTGDLVIDGVTSKADVMFKIEDIVKGTHQEFKISAKNYKSSNFKLHTGKVQNFASAIAAKGREKEAYITRSMFDTISWYPAYFNTDGSGNYKGDTQNNSVFNVFRTMLLLNLDYFYGFDITHLFSSRDQNPTAIADAIMKSTIKRIQINGDSISLTVKAVKKDVQ